MLGLHILIAIGLAAFAKALTPLGILTTFALVYGILRLGMDPLGIRRYVRRLELGVMFTAWFAGEVLKASLDVARIVLGRHIAPQPAVLAIELRERDERVATLLGCLLTLTPGTLALDYQADSGTMYVHALDADDAVEVEDSVRAIETRLLAWLHAGEDKERPAGGDTPS
ncbi:MAG TPA: Na+/H+ antiporter subunit E [Thauera sp.]|jgi:multicomponent Na+:H+ antiporter subunit E|nr:Na+/H+ antiporter subunit E [Thauera sp.]HRA80749.1 Na+/H+ antiporter subunit E [Thauera sp.]